MRRGWRSLGGRQHGDHLTATARPEAAPPDFCQQHVVADYRSFMLIAEVFGREFEQGGDIGGWGPAEGQRRYAAVLFGDARNGLAKAIRFAERECDGSGGGVFEVQFVRQLGRAIRYFTIAKPD